MTYETNTPKAYINQNGVIHEADYEWGPNNTLEPLYTHPKRKPLTDEEVDKAWRSVDYTVPWDQHRIDIARAIEAAHGIKEES